MHRGKAPDRFPRPFWHLNFFKAQQLSPNSPAKRWDPNSSSLTGVTSESFWKHMMPSSSCIGLDLSEACFDNESVENMTPMVVILRVLAIPNFITFPWSDFWCHTISSIQSTSSIHYNFMKFMYHVIQLISYHLPFFKSLLVPANLSEFWVIKNIIRCSFGSDVGRVHQWFETFKGFFNLANR